MSASAIRRVAASLGLLAAALCAGALAGCGDDDKGSGSGGGSSDKATGTGGLTLSSPAFGNNGEIPRKYGFTGDSDVSPPLEWSGVPAGAKSLMLIVDDPDAHGYTHWLVYNIPPAATGLKEGRPAGQRLSDPPGAMQGTSDGPGNAAYTGMDPPPGEAHHYRLTLYALDTTLDLGPGPDKEKLTHMKQGHVLAEVTLTGTYRK